MPFSRRHAFAGLLLLTSLLALGGCTRLFGPEVPRYVIFFEPFSANLDDTARDSIKAAAAHAKAHPEARIYVSGYASADNDPQANRSLSVTRARVVAMALQENGIDRSRLRPKGEGQVEVALDPVEGRRVEISIGAP